MAPEAPGRLSVPEAVAKYIQRKIAAGKRPATIVSYKFTLKLFQDWCPRLYIDAITGDDLLDFAVYCRKRGDSERTTAGRFVDVAGFMKFHGRGRLVPKSDWPKYVERLVESYSEEEIAKFYKAAKTEKEWLLLDLLIHTGFRLGEIQTLTYSDIDFAGCKIHVKPKPAWDWQPKTHECRTVRVPHRIMDNIMAWRDTHPGTLVFPSRVGKPDDHLLRFVQDLGVRAGITGRVDCHKFRSSFATANSAKFKPQDVQRMLGHKNIQTTMRYLAVTDLDDAEFVRKIEETAVRVGA